MSLLPLVSSSEDLARARIELSDVLGLRMRQQGQVSPPEGLLGIWIERRMAAEIPCVLTVHDQCADGRHIHIRESAGLSDIWTILWLETLGGKDRNQVSRLCLLGALVESAGLGQEGRFVPVFRSDTAPSEVQTQMRNLLKWYSHHLMTRLFQDPATGRLFPPDECDA